jgi:hypothetical protein
MKHRVGVLLGIYNGNRRDGYAALVNRGACNPNNPKISC